MSRAAEEQAERWFVQQEKDDARDFVVGATVYRAAFDRIEEGVVRRVSRCDIPPGGGGNVERADGKHPYYVAQFRSDWVDQTYAWRWFAREEQARADLIRIVGGRIEDKRREIRELEALVARLSK